MRARSHQHGERRTRRQQPVDYSRYDGLLDANRLARSAISIVGVGGAASLALNFARAGLGTLTLVDFDHVSATNPPTQAFGAQHIGVPKVDALARDISAINPTVAVQRHRARYESLDESARDKFWSSDLVLAMTDNFDTQALLNRHAIRYRTDTIFAAAYPNAAAVEVTATLHAPNSEGVGCHRCLTFARYRAHALGLAPARPIPSHIFQAEHLNAIIGNLVLSRFGDGCLWRQFARRPMLISRINPSYCSDFDSPFERGVASSLFTTIQWRSDAGGTFVCPDCHSTPESRGRAVLPRNETE